MKKLKESESLNIIYDTGKSQEEVCKTICDVLHMAIELIDNRKTHLSIVYDVKVDKFGSKVCWLHGGLNGEGTWKDYLDTLAQFIVIAEDRLRAYFSKDSEIKIIDMCTDMASDVFDIYLAIQVGREYDETESLDWVSKHLKWMSEEEIDYPYDRETEDWMKVFNLTSY